jgi:transposase
MKKTIYIGSIDVDDSHFNVALINSKNEELLHFKCAANVGSMIKKVKQKNISLKNIKLCYEATYLGFTLYRELKSKGIICEVIAPSLIPKTPGKKVKTDRLDCVKLAKLYLKGMLTPVHIPDEDDEMVRDLIRSRKLLVDQVKKVKTHIISLCKRMGFDYRKSTGASNPAYWTQIHHRWLEKKMNQLPDNSPLRLNLSGLLSVCNNIETFISSYDEQISSMAKLPKYKDQVKALNCFRGLKTLSSLTLTVELGDIRRFPHPTKVTAYSGLAIREYSSGGKEHRFGITKQGNHILRTVVVEACQFASKPPNVSKYLKERRIGADPEYINIADRCMHRLRKKSIRMFINRKHSNKIKVACAREMLCFIWEALNKAAA